MCTLPDVRQLRSIIAAILLAASPSAAAAADLQPRTAAASDRYVQAIESEMPQRSAFLWIDRAGDPARQKTRDAVARGELQIDAVDRHDTGVSRDVPDGLIHHWIGTVFVPGAT